MKIFKSASKIVFMLVALTSCLAFFKGILSADNFMILATGAFAYYFTKAQPTPTSDGE